MPKDRVTVGKTEGKTGEKDPQGRILTSKEPKDRTTVGQRKDTKGKGVSLILYIGIFNYRQQLQKIEGQSHRW